MVLSIHTNTHKLSILPLHLYSDQRGWRVKKLAMANFRSTSLIHFGWLTTDYPFVSCFSMYGFTFDNNSKNCSRDILNWFSYISRSSLVHSTNNVFDAPNVLRLIIHGLTHQRHFFLLFLFSKMCWHSFIKYSHITTTPSRTSSFGAILKSTASFTFVEPCKQYRSTAEFNFIDSTVLINLGDPCKRAFSYELKMCVLCR